MEDILEQTFKVEEPARLRLSNIRGSVDIQPGDEGIIKVTAVKHMDSGNPDNTSIEMEQNDDHQVTVKTHYDKNTGVLFGREKPCEVDYSVQVPPTCSIKLSCVSSTASVRELEGEFSLNSVSGSLNLTELTGPVEIRTVSGKVNADQLSGALDIKTVSAKVSASQSQFPELTCRSVSGHTTFQTPLSEGPYRFNSVSGHVTLIVPEGTGCTATLKSMSGRLRSSLPITHSERSPGSWYAKLEGGGADVQGKSISGHLRILTTEDSEEVEAVVMDASGNPHESTNGSDSAMPILERIERGEISVDDALHELSS